MRQRELLPEDLSVLARRGELSPAEERRFEVYASSSPVTAWLHRLGREYDATFTDEPGDDALLERAVERACERRATERPLRARLHPATLIVAVLACSASAALAAAGVVHWTRSGGAPSDDAASSKSVPSTTVANASAVSKPEATPAVSSIAPQTRAPSAAARPTAHGAPAGPASERHGATARLSPTELFSLANELRKSGRTGEAVSAYRRLQKEYSGAQEASVAHVLLGRILMRHEGPGAAHEEFARYLARHPRGNLAEEALAGSAEALRALGRNADERRVLTTLLSRFPRSIYAGAARERLDELD